jgi:cell division septal protein FtsQ
VSRRTRWIALLGVALVVGLLALANVAIRRLEFFRVHAIEVAGLRHLDETELVAKLGIPDDANILHPLDQIRAAAETLPGIRGVRVQRRWPGTIRLDVREAPPVALAARDGRLVIVDDRAVALPIDPARLEHPLPIVERDTAITALLGRLRATDPQWYRTVDRATIDGREIRLESGPREVIVATGAPAEVFRDLAAVRDRLDRLAITWDRIDARFSGRMFVRKEAV